MNPTKNLYIKSFLLNVTLFGLIFILVENYFFDEPIKPIYIFIVATGIGAIVSIPSVGSHISELKEMGLNINDRNVLNTHQIKQVNSNLTISEIYVRMLESKIKHFKEIKEHPEKLLIESKLTSGTWGEKIEIELLEKSNSNYTYQLSSKPKNKIAILDGGKNMRNIQIIEKIITA